MKLSFKILGFEVATVELDIDLPGDDDVHAVITDPLTIGARVTKWASRRWVRGMLS